MRRTRSATTSKMARNRRLIWAKVARIITPMVIMTQTQKRVLYCWVRLLFMNRFFPEVYWFYQDWVVYALPYQQSFLIGAMMDREIVLSTIMILLILKYSEPSSMRLTFTMTSRHERYIRYERAILPFKSRRPSSGIWLPTSAEVYFHKAKTKSIENTE